MRDGPDLSHWQANVDLARAESSIDFVFVKATESVSYVDPTFAARWKRAGELDIPRGAYHFAHPASNATAQVDHFLRTVEPRWQDGNVAVLDLEGTAAAAAVAGSKLLRASQIEGTITSTRQDEPWEPVSTRASISPGQIAAWAAGWLDAIRIKLGTVPVLYTFPSFYRDTMGNPDLRDLRAVGWIARYGVSDPWQAPWGRLKGWPDVPAIWQCGNGVVGCTPNTPGIGKSDYNQMTEAAFHLLFGPNAGMAASAGAAPTHQTRAEVLALMKAADVSTDPPTAVN